MTPFPRNSLAPLGAVLFNRHGWFLQGGKNHIQLPQNGFLRTGLHLLAGEDAGELLPTPFLQGGEERDFFFAPGRKFDVSRGDKGPLYGKSPGCEFQPQSHHGTWL